MSEEFKNYESTLQGAGQQFIANQLPQRRSNGAGTAGFVLALISLFLGWLPVLGWIVWFLGHILSFVGVFRSPRKLAITGLILSFIGLIISVAIFILLLEARVLEKVLYGLF